MQKDKFKSAFGKSTNHNYNNKKIWNNLNMEEVGMRSTPQTLDTTQLFTFTDRKIQPLFKRPQISELDYKNMDIFHRAVSPILILAQCFAVLPVVGVHRSDPRHLRFSLISLPMMSTLLFLSANSVLTISMTKHLLQIGLNAKNFVGLAFFLCVQPGCVLFLLLAPRWPRLMSDWLKTELIFIRKPYEAPKRSLSKRVQIAATVIIFLSVCEHGFYLASAVYSYRRKTQLCSSLLNTTSSFSFSEFVRSNYDYAFKVLPDHGAWGVFILATNGTSTFIWNFIDLFIVMISMGIAYRFEQIKLRVNKLAKEDTPESTFAEIRDHYVKVCELLENVDDNIAGLIMLSCMNNLYFICAQLLNIFNKLRWPINYVYFWYSMLYLIGRTAYVFLTAASINDESKASLSVLRRVSKKNWCIEVERLIFLMTTQTVALSGKKFYFLTRRLLFGMAGTIVTYELVLLQFDEPTRSKGLPDLCA